MSMEGLVVNSAVEDEALEAELMALLGGVAVETPQKAPRKRSAVSVLDQIKGLSIELHDDLSDVDEDDPALLAELSDITNEGPSASQPAADTASTADPPSSGDLTQLLLERLQAYKLAEANAKQEGQAGRARRFGRGLKTIEMLLRRARSGQAVCDEDIPPAVVVASSPPPAVVPAAPDSHQSPPPATHSQLQPSDSQLQPSDSQLQPSDSEQHAEVVSDDVAEHAVAEDDVQSPTKQRRVSSVHPRLGEVQRRRDEYKSAAVRAKKVGQREVALEHVKVVKAFERVIADMEAGCAVDLSDMPPAPAGSVPAAAARRPPLLRSGSTRGGMPLDEPVQIPDEGIPPADRSLYNAPPPPGTVMEALQQRLQRYREGQAEAKQSANASKVRRYGRICKQYTDAISRYQAGKTVNFDELPTPPGFGPIPVQQTAAEAAPASVQPQQPVSPPRAGRQHSTGHQTRVDKQLAVLESRRKLFIHAAVQAKKAGDMDQAKEFLRQSKGFDPLIEATIGGLPVNMDTLPVPPQHRVKVASDFEVISRDEVAEAGSNADATELFHRLEADLLRQVQVCQTNCEHYRALGDVAQANKFDQLGQHCSKDVQALRLAFRKQDDFLPKIHYETREFRIVQACTDLSDNVLELTVLRGVNYTVENPQDVDTYVKWEFPWPADAAATGKTAKVKNTNNPQYDESFKIAIDRSSRSMLRVFKRHSIKCEVWQRGRLFGWTDQLIGAAQIKLEDLQSKCVVHKAYNVTGGRRAIKGKLEVRMRMRKPAVSDHIEQVLEKWLVIDKL